MRRLMLLALIWGWSFLFIKVAVEGLTPTTVAWARIALGAAVLQILLRRQGLEIPQDRLLRLRFALVSVAGNILPFTLLAWAEEHITSALTAVLNASTPLFTAVFAAAALSERLRALQIAGLAVGIAGVSVAAGLGASDVQGSSLAGTLAALGAGAGYGVAFVYTRRHLLTVPPLVGAATQLTAGALLLAPVAVTTSVVSGVSLTPTRVLSITLLGAVGTGVAFVLLYRSNAELGPTRTSLVTYLIPLVAIVVGVVALDEPFEWRLVAGVLLTIAGIAGVTLGRRPAPDPGSPPPPDNTPQVATT